MRTAIDVVVGAVLGWLGVSLIVGIFVAGTGSYLSSVAAGLVGLTGLVLGGWLGYRRARRDRDQLADPSR